MIRFLYALVFTVILASQAFAKRLEPVEVKPVHFKGIIYSVPPFILDEKSPQNGGFLEARDGKDKLIWRVQIYKTAYNPLLEQDVQDVFINSLSLDKAHGILMISDEKDRIFTVDIFTKKVTRLR